MNNRIANNLLTSGEVSIRICTVTRPLGNGKYQCQDAHGRTLTAAAIGSASYQAGQGVRVVRGQITGSYGMAASQQTIKV